jgi:multiple sugar transport system substrate-binding protein
MAERELDVADGSVMGRRLSRRAMVRMGMAMAALPILAACGSQQAAAPAKPTSAPAAPAATTAPAAAAKPTEAPKPAAPAAAPAATTAPAAAAKPAEAAKPAQTAAGTSAGRTAPPAPEFKPVKIDGKLSVIIDADFHPDHNVFIEKKVREFAEKMNYPLDFSTVAAFTGTANISQKLTAAVQSGDPPDCITHTESTSTLHFLDVLEDVDDLQKQIIKDFGEPYKAAKAEANIDGKWWSAQHFSRAGGYWYREGAFKAIGVDPKKDFTDFDKVTDALVKASNPEKESWGWGMTANRSGDGETIVKNHVLLWGGQLTEQTGQLVVLNKDPFRQYAIDGLTYLKAIYSDPKFAKMLPTGVNSWTDPSNNEAYLAGKIFFSNNAGTMFAKAVFDKNPVKDDTYLMMPPKGLGAGGRVLAGGGAAKRWFVVKGAKNREAAEQLIRFMHGADIQKEMFKISNGYVYPAYEWGWDEPEIKASDAGTHVTDVWKQYLNHESGYTGGGYFPASPVPWVTSLESSNFWTDMFGEVLGGKSPADAVKSAHDRAVRVAKEFGFKGE